MIVFFSFRWKIVKIKFTALPEIRPGDIDRFCAAARSPSVLIRPELKRKPILPDREQGFAPAPFLNGWAI